MGKTREFTSKKIGMMILSMRPKVCQKLNLNRVARFGIKGGQNGTNIGLFQIIVQYILTCRSGKF